MATKAPGMERTIATGPNRAFPLASNVMSGCSGCVVTVGHVLS
jgi:hypothetical protein